MLRTTGRAKTVRESEINKQARKAREPRLLDLIALRIIDLMVMLSSIP